MQLEGREPCMSVTEVKGSYNYIVVFLQAFFNGRFFKNNNMSQVKEVKGCKKICAVMVSIKRVQIMMISKLLYVEYAYFLFLGYQIKLTEFIEKKKNGITKSNQDIKRKEKSYKEMPE